MRHPDEGTIHTWLDGQLPRDEAAAIEAHVAECQPCADAVAEARGLIAASSRILLALDGVPRGVAPKQTMPGAVGQGADVAPVPVAATSESSPNEVIDLPARAAAVSATRDRRAPRRWMSGPSLAAAAAIIVAVGSFTVLQNRVKDRFDAASSESATPTSGPSPDVAAPVAQSPAVATRSAPPPSASGAASTRANELPAASAESRAVAPVRGLTDGAKGAAANAKVGAQEEAKHLAEVNRPLEAPRLAKEQERFAADSVVRRQRLASAQAFADSAQTKKAETTTVTVLRGRSVASASQTQAVPAAPPPAQSPAPAQTEVRDSRSDAAGLNRSATTGFIRGRVTDGNGTGIPNVQVLVAGTSTASLTNDRGEFSVGGVAAGQVVVRARSIGYQENRRTVAVAVGQTVVADFVMIPAATTLENVVVTGTGTTQRRSVGSSVAAVTAKDEVSASNAIGCYELGITASTAQRRATSLTQVPRRVALDGDVVPSNVDGIWYRARDLAPDGTLITGLWRPLGTNGVEVEWKYGTKVARIRLTGAADVMMRGTVDEMDSSAGTNESGSVVSSRRNCQ
jgi:hypothetical protein